jgi:hypothetical protein
MQTRRHVEPGFIQENRGGKRLTAARKGAWMIALAGPSPESVSRL